MTRTVYRPFCAVSVLALAVGISLAAPSEVIAQEAPGAPAAASNSQSHGVLAWDIPSADFPADPNITFGVLPNGMRYAIQRNTNPKGEAAVRFSIAAGSREEADAENGAAHFVEHIRAA